MVMFRDEVIKIQQAYREKHQCEFFYKIDMIK